MQIGRATREIRNGDYKRARARVNSRPIVPSRTISLYAIEATAKLSSRFSLLTTLATQCSYVIAAERNYRVLLFVPAILSRGNARSRGRVFNWINARRLINTQRLAEMSAKRWLRSNKDGNTRYLSYHSHALLCSISLTICQIRLSHVFWINKWICASPTGLQYL